MYHDHFLMALTVLYGIPTGMGCMWLSYVDDRKPITEGYMLLKFAIVFGYWIGGFFLIASLFKYLSKNSVTIFNWATIIQNPDPVCFRDLFFFLAMGGLVVGLQIAALISKIRIGHVWYEKPW